MTEFGIQWSAEESVWFGSREGESTFKIPTITQSFFIEGPDDVLEDVENGMRALASLERFRTRRRTRLTAYSKNGTQRWSKIYKRPRGGCRTP